VAITAMNLWVSPEEQELFGCLSGPEVCLSIRARKLCWPLHPFSAGGVVFFRAQLLGLAVVAIDEYSERRAY
jgi:hypothetical protein